MLKVTEGKLYEKCRKLGNKRKTIFVNVVTEVTLRQPYWDGGSRQSHYYVPKNAGPNPRMEVLNVQSLAWPQVGESKFSTNDYEMIIEGGISCGKQAFWSVYISPEVAERYDLAVVSKEKVIG